MSGFAGITETMCGSEEAAAYFRIFQSAADAFNRTNRDWMISLSNSVSHASAKFNSNDAALG
ncbi:MAG: hypothetical protein QG650_781 [Patescibacteria group bacterium]|nr:hypothetical protein [Patescibacteria group bacterium]